MSQEERHGTRDRAYSAWHRRMSTRRFVGIEAAQTLAMIDLDASLYVEYDDGTKEPLALCETAIDQGQFKPSTVTAKLAARARLEAYVVLYTLSDALNEADPRWQDISAFRVRQIYPNQTRFYELTPQQCADALVRIRQRTATQLDGEWFASFAGSVAA